MLSWGSSMDRGKVPQLEILSGWKEIANHLGKGVRTVQRYERELGLPVRRVGGRLAGSVIATKAELDGWVTASPLRGAFPLPQASAEYAPFLGEFRKHVAETRRLRKESEKLRLQVAGSLEMLQKNLSALLSQNQTANDSPRQRRSANVIAFDPNKKAI